MRRSLVLSAAVALACVGFSAGAAQAASSGAQPWAWGSNTSGQLGAAGVTASTVPLAVPGVASATAVAAGESHTLAVLPNGTVEAWGDNRSGELGNGSVTSSNGLPGPVPGLTGATAIAAGSGDSMALLSDGSVYTWGLNNYGQLGNQSTTNSDVPVEAITRSVTAIAAGYGHSLALFGGWVFAWGLDNHGQLGNGSTTNSGTPTGVSGITTAKAISAGDSHSLALLSNGTIDAWGWNGYGQLGNGSTTDSTVPGLVAGITTATAIAAGDAHSLALLSNGSVEAWGSNSLGQLGNGSTTASSLPVAVPGLSDVVGIAAGRESSYALKSDGTLWAWGSDYIGQLGTGTTTDSHVPVQVGTLGNGVTAIAAGPMASHAIALAHPVASLSPSSLAFGTQPLNTIGVAKSLTLTNTGAPGLTENATSNSGTNPDDFINGNDTCAGQALGNGASCHIDLRFAPSAASGTAETATVTVWTNAPGAQPQAALAGTAGSLPQGPPGPRGATGPRGPSGKIELVSCRTITVLVKQHRVSRQKCAGRLVSGPVKFTMTGSGLVHATIIRGQIVYARGVSVSAGPGRSELVMRDLRPLRRGRYTLILHARRGRRSTTTRRVISVS